MKENQKVPLIIILFTILQILVIWFLLPKYSERGSFYKEIDVNYQDLKDKILVNEKFDTVIKDDWNAIYRSFGDEICFKEDCKINIQDVNCKIGIPYISLLNGALYMKIGGTWKPINKFSLNYGYKIYKNEVGCYNNNDYYGKEEELEIKYMFPKSYLEKYNYIHALFTQDHLSIKLLKTPTDEKEEIPKDVPIFINIKNGEIKVADYKFYIFGFIIFLNSIVYLLWYFFGSDKDFLVPKYLHRKPVNPKTNKEEDYITYGLLYNAGKVDKNILTALLFSLKLKGLLKKVEKKGFLTKSFIFHFNKEMWNKPLNLNKYEEKFLKKLEKLGKKKETDDEIIIELETYRDIKEKMYNFFTKSFPSTVKRRLDDKSLKLFFVVIVFMYILTYVIVKLYIDNPFLAKYLIISLTLYSFVSILIYYHILRKEFVRYKSDYYKEYLEIESFRRFLNDYAQLKKYFPEDEVIWKDWLLIATALGVADNVLKVLRERGYNIDGLLDYKEMTSVANSFYNSTVSFSSSGGAGGGTFGGAGGGGGGGR
jgi:hypothetical protein